MNNIVLFGGFCSGKTTLARALEDELGYRRVSMAGNMKWIVQQVYGTLDKSATMSVTLPNGASTDRTIREVLQIFGDAAKTVDRDFWIRWFLADTAVFGGGLVMDDGRLAFEARELRNRGWAIVKVDTPRDIRIQRAIDLYGKAPSEAELGHVTETQLEMINYDLIVDGTLPVLDLAYDLFAKVNPDESV